MCCTLADFVGRDIGGQVLTEHFSAIISAYVEYLGACSGGCGGCVGSNKERGVHYCAIKWNGGDAVSLGQSQFGVGADPEVLDTFGEGGLCDKTSSHCVGGQANSFKNIGERGGQNDGGATSSIDVSKQFDDKGAVQKESGSGDSLASQPGVNSSLQSGTSRGYGVSRNYLPRGPNYERNKINRDGKKRRKWERKNGGGIPVLKPGDGHVLRDQDVGQSKGFWNSCDPETRELLIKTKARMHAAENLRKAKEAEQRAADMDSPYNLMLKAVKMAEFAKKQSEAAQNDKICGWAKTVATSSAESLARSVPNSVPSFSELEEKLAASSQSSFELDLARKDAEIADVRDQLERSKVDNEKLEMEVAEIKLKKGKVSKSGLVVPSAFGKVGNWAESVEDDLDFGVDVFGRKIHFPPISNKGFVPTKKQPWPHVKLTYDDCHDRNL